MQEQPESRTGPAVVGAPRQRAPRRLVSVSTRPERVLAIIFAVVLAAAVSTYDVAGIRNLHQDPVTGVDYLPVVKYVEARREPGQQVLVALPPPAYLAFGSSDNLIFLSSPLARKRAQRYTRIGADGNYVDYWTGVDSIVDTAGLCRLISSDPKLLIIVDESRLEADWAFKGTMAAVIDGMTYIRYEADGGAMVRGISPLPSRSSRAEQICAQALTGNIDENATDDESGDTNQSTGNDINAEPTTSP